MRALPVTTYSTKVCWLGAEGVLTQAVNYYDFEAYLPTEPEALVWVREDFSSLDSRG